MKNNFFGKEPKYSHLAKVVSFVAELAIFLDYYGI